MSRAFNAVMRLISSLIGVLMVLMGGIWILQGLNLAWGFLSRSFMQGDQHWVFYGAIMLIVGVCQVVWSNTRQGESDPSTIRATELKIPQRSADERGDSPDCVIYLR